MNCLKLDFSLKQELTKPDLARLKAVGYKPVGEGHVWPVFQSMRPSWAFSPVNEEEAVQLREDLLKTCRFARWFERSKHVCESHLPTEIPVVGLGDNPLVSGEIDWTPLLPPMTPLEDVLGGMSQHRVRPERILASDEKIFKMLEPACAQIGVEIKPVDKLVAAPDALESLTAHLRRSPR